LSFSTSHSRTNARTLRTRAPARNSMAVVGDIANVFCATPKAEAMTLARPTSVTGTLRRKRVRNRFDAAVKSLDRDCLAFEVSIRLNHGIFLCCLFLFEFLIR